MGKFGGKKMIRELAKTLKRGVAPRRPALAVSLLAGC